MVSSTKRENCKEMCNTLDLVCRKVLHKSLPLNVIRDIYVKLIKMKRPKKNENSTRLDEYLVYKGNVKKKWKEKNYETGQTKFRIRHAYRYGR